MDTNRKTAVIVGILYIIGTVAGILSVAFTSRIFNASDYLARVSANTNQITIGAFFVLIMGFALAMIPVMMFPILKKQNEALALGYLIFRGALETVTYILCAINWLLLISLSLAYGKAGIAGSISFQPISALLLAAADRSTLMTVFVFGLGALIFYSLLFKSNLIPRWISIWGLIAIGLHLITGLLIAFGLTSISSQLVVLMDLPIAIQEMVMAVWLIAKGFGPSAIRVESAVVEMN